MKDEYVIINKTAIQKRIEELGKKYIVFSNKSDRSLSDIEEEREIVGEQKALATILSQSTPLIPEIEKGIKYGFNIGGQISKLTPEMLQEYISNLTLDI